MSTSNPFALTPSPSVSILGTLGADPCVRCVRPGRDRQIAEFRMRSCREIPASRRCQRDGKCRQMTHRIFEREAPPLPDELNCEVACGNGDSGVRRADGELCLRKHLRDSSALRDPALQNHIRVGHERVLPRSDRAPRHYTAQHTVDLRGVE